MSNYILYKGRQTRTSEYIVIVFKRYPISQN